MAWINQKETSEKLAEATELNRQNSKNAQRQIRNAEVIAAMGMLPAIKQPWRRRQDAAIAAQEDASKKAGVFSAVIKTARLASQSTAIAAGAYLVLSQEISPGMLIAGSILISRALQPVELAVGAWGGFVDAKVQYERLNKLLGNSMFTTKHMKLPPVTGEVLVSNAALMPPGAKRPTLTGMNFVLPAGSVCLVIGASGSGKSTLVRGLLGLWPTVAGAIRIDGAEAFNYDRVELGQQIGYLPQDIELFEGSVAANIARFGEVDSEKVIQAAHDAGIHEFILTLSSGYDTIIDQAAGYLSPGQKQRIALARAVYARPKLVVLDEPNSNLDDAGEAALGQTIKLLKQSGSTVVVVSHRRSTLPLSDFLLILRPGGQADFGPTSSVVERLKRAKSEKAIPANDKDSTPRTVTW